MYFLHLKQHNLSFEEVKTEEKGNERVIPSTQGTALEILLLNQKLPRLSIAFVERKTENNFTSLIKEIE